MNHKMNQNRRQKSTYDMKAFKSLLDPSWARLGRFGGRSWGKKSLIVCASRHPPRRFGGLDA